MKGGKGLLSKKGGEIAVEQISIPKRRRSKTIIEEVDESEQMDDLGDSEETEKEQVESLVRHRSTGVAIGSEAYKESKIKEERVGHLKKLRGLETLFEAAQLKLDLKKARKGSKDEFYI
nr:hypothetical protein [Tanacetum cinerariifolium]